MQEKNINNLITFKKATTFAVGVGFVIFLFSIIENDFNKNFFLSMLGISIMAASLVSLGFGMFLHLIEEVAEKSNGINTFPTKDNLYYFLEKRRTYY